MVLINVRKNAYSGVISAFFYNATRNAPLQIHGDGNQTRDFVYVTDVANANLLAASSDAANLVVNIGSGRETSINELAMTIKKIALSDSSIEHDAPRIATAGGHWRISETQSESSTTSQKSA